MCSSSRIAGDRARGRHLHLVELAQPAAHPDEQRNGDAVAGEQLRQCVDRIAEAAALHEHRRATACGVDARRDADRLLLPRRGHDGERRVGFQLGEHLPVDGVRHVRRVPDLVLAQTLDDNVRPVHGRRIIEQPRRRRGRACHSERSRGISQETLRYAPRSPRGCCPLKRGTPPPAPLNMTTAVVRVTTRPGARRSRR